MKNICSIIILMSAIFLFHSCSKFLQEEPKSFIAPESFFNNDADAKAAILGVYGTLTNEGYYGAFFHRLEGATDEFHPRPGVTFDQSELGSYQASSSSINMQGYWASAYELIKEANTVIENVDGNSKISQKVRDQVVGEALFLRAYTYYWMTLLFGDVPLILKPYNSLDNIYPARDPRQTVLNQAKTDAQQAITLLPLKSAIPAAEGGRVGKGAAQVLLAKLHMVNGEWNEALTQVNAVIASGVYSLWPSVTQVFKVANENGRESVFEVNFSNVLPPNPVIGSSHPQVFCAAGVVNRAFSTYFPTSILLEKFGTDVNDERRKNWIWDYNYLTGKPFPVQVVPQPPMCMKFYDRDFNVGGDGLNLWRRNENNFIVFRYADVLLMKAELENEAGSQELAVQAINEVRNRAKATPMPSPSGLSKDAFREFVFDERARELFGEGHRMLDLRRRGFAYLKEKVQSRTYNGEFFTPNIDAKYEFYPIPQIEIDANENLVQNQGW